MFCKCVAIKIAVFIGRSQRIRWYSTIMSHVSRRIEYHIKKCEFSIAMVISILILMNVISTGLYVDKKDASTSIMVPLSRGSLRYKNFCLVTLLAKQPLIQITLCDPSTGVKQSSFILSIHLIASSTNYHIIPFL